MIKNGVDISKTINGKYLLVAGLDENAEEYDKIYEDADTHYVYHISLNNGDKNAKHAIYANGKLCETCSMADLASYIG